MAKTREPDCANTYICGETVKLERWLPLLLWGVLILGPLVVVTLFFAVDRDGGAFLTIANGILDGKLPYRDFFDHKPPGIYIAFALVLALTKRSIWGIKVFLLLLSLGFGFFTNWSLQGLGFGKKTRWLGGTLGLLGWIIYQGYTPVTETLVACCLAAALAVLFSQRKGSTFGAGFFLGLATLTKQPVALLVIPFVAYASMVKGKRAGLIFLSAFVFSLGIAGAALWILGLGPSAWHQIVVVNFTNLPLGDIREIVKGNFNQFFLAPTLWILAVLTPIFHRRRENYFLSALLLFSWVPVFLRPISHYILVALPAGVILAAMSAHWLIQQMELQGRYALVCLVGFPLWLQGLFPTMAAFSHNVLFLQRQVGVELQTLTRENDPILVIAAEPQYYFFSHRYPPGEDLYLLAINYSSGKESAMIAEIQKKTVRVIAVAENQYTEKYGSLVRDYVEHRCKKYAYFPNLQLYIWNKCQ